MKSPTGHSEYIALPLEGQLVRWCQLRSRSYASRSGTTSIQSAGFYGRISLLGESQASIDTPAWHALDSARNEPIKGEKEAMRAGALAVLGMGLAMVCPGEGVFGQALNPALARAEAELEAFRLYAACELLAPFPVRVDGQGWAGIAAQVGLNDLDIPISESLSETLRERLDEWGLLDRDRDTALGESVWFEPSVTLSSGPQMQIRVEFSKRLRDEYGNSWFMTTWERVIPPPPRRYVEAGPGVVEDSLLAAVDEFAAEYLRINARAC